MLKQCYSKTVSRERFLFFISRLLFEDMKSLQSSPVFNKFLYLCVLSMNIVLDKSLMKFVGRLSYVLCYHLYFDIVKIQNM
jgi:hypothetical protein